MLFQPRQPAISQRSKVMQKCSVLWE